MAATRAGDDYAFERLYKRYQRRIAAYVVGMVHDHGRAEDITQEVFMSALRRMRETERPIVFKPWVYEIAKNACIDAFRRSKRAEEISYDAEEGLGGSDYGRLVSSTPAPDAAVDTRQSLDHLRGAFGGLSETHHDILVMRELEGLSYREIGRRLGMSRPSVESTLFRARRRLSEEYEELTSGERCKRVQTMIAGGGERRLGVRDERKLARHVSHCQPCRRAAYAAGFDVAELQRKTSLGAKVAGLLPFPAFVKRWFGRGGDGGGSSSSSVAQWSATIGQHAEPISGWAKAAALAATVAVAGVGAGVATTHGDADVKAPRPATAGSVPASAASAAAAAKAAGAATTGSGRATVSSSQRSAAKSSSSSSRAKRGAARRAGGGSGGGSGSAGGGSAGRGSSSGGGSAAASAPAGSGGGSASSAAKAGVAAPKLNAPQVQAPKTGNSTVDQATGAVTGTVNTTAGAATGAVNNAAGAATGAVNGAVGAVGGAVNQASGGAAGGAVTGATGAATGAVNGATGAATGAVNGAVGTATGAVSNPAGTVAGAASDPAGTVGGAVGGLVPHG